MIHARFNVSSRRISRTRITRPVRRGAQAQFNVYCSFCSSTAKSVCYNDKEEIIRVVLYNDFVISRLSQASVCRLFYHGPKRNGAQIVKRECLIVLFRIENRSMAHYGLEKYFTNGQARRSLAVYFRRVRNSASVNTGAGNKRGL